MSLNHKAKSISFVLRSAIAAVGGNWKNQNRRNAAVSGVGAILNPVLQLVATPLLFHKLGASSFGVWSLIMSVVATSGIASLGLGEAGTKYVALYRARNDQAGVIRVIRSIGTLYIGLGTIMCAIIIGVAPYLASSLLKVTASDLPFVVDALRIAAVGVLIRFLYAIAEAAVRGYERYDKESIWAMTNSVGTTLIAMGCVIFGGGVRAVVLSGVVMSTICLVGLSLSLTRLVGSWRWAYLSLDRSSYKETFGFGVFSWIQNLNGLFSYHFDRIFIGAWLGPTAAGYYSVCLQVFQTAHGVLARALGFLFPAVVKLRNSQNVMGLMHLFKKGMLLTTSAGWLISSFFIFFAHEFLLLWMGADFAQHSELILQLLGAWNAFMATSVVPFYFLNGTGREKLNTVMGTLSTGVFVSSAFICIKVLGSLGAPIARLITTVVSVVNRTIVIREITGDRRWYVGVFPLFPTAVGSLVAGLVILASANSKYTLLIRGAGFLLSGALVFRLSSTVYSNLLNFSNTRNLTPVAPVSEPLLVDDL